MNNKTQKDDTREKISIYFQTDNEQSRDVYLRLQNICKITAMSESAIAGMAVRLAITQLEEALIEPEQLINTKVKDAKKKTKS
jgi:hypothetical protein